MQSLARSEDGLKKGDLKAAAAKTKVRLESSAMDKITWKPSGARFF